MFRSLHMKLVLVLVLLVSSVMIVMGTFFLNSVTSYYIEEFQSQMTQVFTPELILTLQNAAEKGGAQSVQEIMQAYTSLLGIGPSRSYYVLDGENGAYLSGSDDKLRDTLPITSNILTALSGGVGQKVERLSEYFDVAIPIKMAGSAGFIVGVMDNKAELSSLSWNLLNILIRTLIFGLLAALILSFLLSKTITRPVERLTSQAARIAAGEFGAKEPASSTDEIGVLTQTFNEMATVLESTLKEVEEERDKLDTLFQHMADGVVAFDRRGKLMHINPAAEQMLGRHPDPDAGYGDIFPNLQIEEQDVDKNGHYVDVDYAANGRIFKILFAPFGLGEAEGGLMAVLQDVTRQQKLEESRREFVSNVSHELRTPLTNIKGYTETLLDAGDEIDKDTQRKFLSVVHSEADRMTRIVKDLLTLSRLDYNRLEMHMEPVSMSDLAHESVRVMQIEAQNQDVKLLCPLEDRLPIIWGDRERMTQVLINIISNAIKYNRPKGLVEVSGSSDSEMVYLVVRDTGIGIPKSDLSRVFDRFYRVEKARSRERGGTGLGLAIAREIVQAHNGCLTMDSVENEGTTVTVALPRMGDQEANA